MDHPMMMLFDRAIPRALPGMVAIAALLSVSACQDTGTGGLLPDDQYPTKGQSMEVIPSVAALVSAGERVQLSANVRDALGKQVSNPQVSWVSMDPTVATVDGTGTVTGRDEGVAEVKGTYGTMSATAVIAVSRRKINNDKGSASVTVYPDADTVTVIGGTAKLLAVGRNNGGNLLSGNSLNWQTSGPDIATVDGSGVVTGLKTGFTQVIVQNGSAADTADLWVAPSDVAVEIRISPSGATIPAVGGTVQLTAELLNGASDPILGKDIGWKSLDPGVASVIDGKVLGASKGIARIVASHQALQDTALVTVAPTQSAASLYVTPKTDTIPQIGGTVQLKAVALDANGQQMSGASITWGTLDAAVASVSSTGLVKAAAVGQARITARMNTLVDTAMIWVAPPPPTPQYVITVDPSIVKLGAVGDTIRLTATVKDSNGNTIGSAGALWSSLDVQTANVSTAGPATSVRVKAIGSGTARIVGSYGGASDTAVISIAGSSGGGTTSGNSVTITPQPAVISSLGETVSLLWEVYDATGTRIPEVFPSWTSLDPSVATVPTGPSRKADVTGIGAGTARIVTSWNGMVDTATVEVKDGPVGGSSGPSVSVTPSSSTLQAIGSTMQLSASAWDTQGVKAASNQIIWTSLDPAIVIVNGSGVVTATANGNGRVKASYSTAADTAFIWVNTAAPGTQLTPSPLMPLLGPLVRRGTGVTVSSLSTYDQRYQQEEYKRFQDYLAVENDPGGAYLNANHYGGLRSRLSWAIRNGESWGPGVKDESRFGYARGLRIVRRYLQYSKSWKFNVPVQNNTGLADIELLYRLEGDPDARTHIHVTAEIYTNDPYGYLKLTNPQSGARIPAVAMQAFNAAYRLGIPYAHNTVNPNVSIDGSISSWKQAGERLISWFDQYNVIQADGSIYTPSNGGDTYFMDAMIATQLLSWCANVQWNQRAFDQARLIMDHLIRSQKPGWSSLGYLDSSPSPSDDLAGYYIWPSLVLWQETKDQKYYDFAMKNMQAMSGAYIYQMKQFNQVYSTQGQDFEALAAGVPWR
jgi:Bacterial Ig-like domain (group 2)